MQILYGRGPGPSHEWSEPEIERFRQSEEGVEVEFKGVSVISVEEDESITWEKILRKEYDRESLDRLRRHGRGPIEDKVIDEVCEEIRDECHPNSKVERKFFNLFVRMCRKGAFDRYPSSPALVPSVWVNWYPNEIKRKRKKEPHIVDFAIKDSHIEDGELTIIEIDGPSHYAEYDEEGREYTVSEKKYATHLRNDRFLRRITPRVIRIGRSEIQSIAVDRERDLYHFYQFWKQAFESDALIPEFETEDPWL